MFGNRIRSIVRFLTVFLIASTTLAEETPVSARSWAELMGSWRMTGQARRGSAQGAWTSAARAEWSESPPRRLTIEVPDSKSFRTISIQTDPKTGDASAVELTMSDATVRSLARMTHPSNDRFVFEESPTVHNAPLRLTLYRKSRDRWTGSLESRNVGSTGWSRIQELGLTRQGTTIAQGSGSPACVVTGGLGEIAVMVNGRTAYVCCSGCRDTLLADPDAFLPAREKRTDPQENPSGSTSP